MDKNEIIAELRRVAELLGTSSLTIQQFREQSSISVATVEHEFGTWAQAVQAAGFSPMPSDLRPYRQDNVSDEEYLKEIIRLTQLLGRRPTHREMDAKGRFGTTSYRRRWGTWNKACEAAYSKFGNPLVSEGGIIYGLPRENIATTPRKIAPETYKPPQVAARKKIQYGEPIDFRGLRHAPINEQGVVYVFGMVSQELGFLIESVRTGYPDCEGKRCVDTKRQLWESVLIEFEYRSSNFLQHGHNPDGCDLIVCWIHDWNECPIDVLKLKSAIKNLPDH